MSRSLWLSLIPVVFLLLWSGGYTVAKVGIGESEPFTLLSLRYFGVLVLLLPPMLWIRPALPDSAAAWFHLMLVGFLIQVAYFGTCWTAFRLGASASTVALITSLQPILVALAVPWAAGESVSPRRWIGLIIGLFGTVMVIVGNQGVQPTSPIILLFTIMALLAMSTATVWEKRFGVSHHPLTQNVVQYAVGLAFTLPMALTMESLTVNPSGAFWFALVYLVVGNSILAISLLLYMIRNGEAARVSALFFLVPPLSALIAWWFLDERMTGVAWGGLVIAAWGVHLAGSVRWGRN